jgi:bacteriocin-like protein
MKELNKTELTQINGGSVESGRKAGQIFGDFLAFATACVLYTVDTTVDVIKAIL